MNMLRETDAPDEGTGGDEGDGGDTGTEEVS